MIDFLSWHRFNCSSVMNSQLFWNKTICFAYVIKMLVFLSFAESHFHSVAFSCIWTSSWQTVIVISTVHCYSFNRAMHPNLPHGWGNCSSDYKIGICNFSAKQVALWKKTAGRVDLVQNWHHKACSRHDKSWTITRCTMINSDVDTSWWTWIH